MTPTSRPAAPPAVPRAPGRAARPEQSDTTREGDTMTAQPEFVDHEGHHDVRRRLAELKAKAQRLEADAQVAASLSGASWKPLEDRHTARELARRVARLETQVEDTERQRDDLQVRLSNAEIELGRLRARPRPWWRR